MTFVLFFIVTFGSMVISAAMGAGLPDDTELIILAILSAGEVIAHACEKR